MTDQSPRDALAFAIAKTIRPDMHDSRWRNFVRLTDTHPDDPEWAADLPVRQCRVIADAVLAWLAEPAQIEAMAIGYFNSGGSCDWTDWNSVDGTTLQNAVRARQMDAVAALRGKP